MCFGEDCEKYITQDIQHLSQSQWENIFWSNAFEFLIIKLFFFLSCQNDIVDIFTFSQCYVEFAEERDSEENTKTDGVILAPFFIFLLIRMNPTQTFEFGSLEILAQNWMSKHLFR